MYFLILISLIFQLTPIASEQNYRQVLIDEQENNKTIALTSHQIRMDTVQALKEEFGLEFYGFDSRIKSEIKHLTLILDYPGALNKEEAKKMVERASELYLEKINSNQIIQRYLIERPFTTKHVEVKIRTPKEIEEPETIAEISLSERILLYTLHPEKKTKAKKVLQETLSL